MRQAGERVAGFLAAVDPTTYGDDRVDPGGVQYTVARCLLHALEHTQEHFGHACLTRQMWEQGHAQPVGTVP